jgi:hypothetical protein
VELAGYEASARTITVEVKPRSLSKYDVRFIGRGGRLLKAVPIDPDPGVAGADGRAPLVAPPAVYEIRGDEGYVRAKVVESNGSMAWTRPVVVHGAVLEGEEGRRAGAAHGFSGMVAARHSERGGYFTRSIGRLRGRSHTRAGEPPCNIGDSEARR